MAKRSRSRHHRRRHIVQRPRRSSTRSKPTKPYLWLERHREGRVLFFDQWEQATAVVADDSGVAQTQILVYYGLRVDEPNADGTLTAGPALFEIRQGDEGIVCSQHEWADLVEAMRLITMHYLGPHFDIEGKVEPDEFKWAVVKAMRGDTESLHQFIAECRAKATPNPALGVDIFGNPIEEASDGQAIPEQPE